MVKAAAILHDIGICEAENKHGSSAPKYQEIEGPPIAKKILKKYDIDDNTIEHICKIIANHHTGKGIDTPEFKIVWDADQLVNIPEDYTSITNIELKHLIEKLFKTNTGSRIAAVTLFKIKTVNN